MTFRLQIAESNALARQAAIGDQPLPYIVYHFRGHHIMPVSQDRIAEAFFGYFPTWSMFSHDIRTQRDTRDPKQAQEEGWVKQALSYLADLVGRSHDDLLGQYASVQNGGITSAGAADDLLRCYDRAFTTYYGKPSGAFPPR